MTAVHLENTATSATQIKRGLTVCAIILFAFTTHFVIAQNVPTARAVSDVVDVYVPLDNWIYPALDRLRGLGYLDTAFLGERPWTRRSIAVMLAEADSEEGIHDDPQTAETYTALAAAFPATFIDVGPRWKSPAFLSEETYQRVQGITGLPLRDSFHLGQSFSNDYGRPYQQGFNSLTGTAASMQTGRLSLYVRSEYQHAPSGTGYSNSLSGLLSAIDLVPFATNPVQATIPEDPVSGNDVFRIVEANLSYRLLKHQISFGKSDHWLSPAKGGSFLYSNNAENIYAFQVDRTEPLYVPYLSRLTGPFRYQFFVGSLKGHTDPRDPWMHTQKISFMPTKNIEFGFSRSSIWGGEGHVPITMHTFLNSFFSFQNVSVAQKNSREDPGARFGTFDFSWRIPFLSHWLTLYSDSLVHDDVSPTDAPRHAGVRPGIFLSEVPGIPRLDFRVEGVSTDPPVRRSNGGRYLYIEIIQVQGYTNKGFIMGDSFGRESKGGQAWLSYHLSPRDLLQASFRNMKVAKDFVPSGTTQNSFDLHTVKVFRSCYELSVDLQHEWWKAPIYQAAPQNNTSLTVQLKWSPPLRHDGTEDVDGR